MIKRASAAVSIASVLLLVLPGGCAARADESYADPASSTTRPAEAKSQTPAQRRLAVLAAGDQGEAGLSQLTAAMNDPAAMVRRAAVRCLAKLGAPAADALERAAVKDDDALVRRTAIRELGRIEGEKSLPVLSKALEDKDPLVRMAAVETLADLQPRSPAIVALLMQAQKDKDAQVSRAANGVLWPFHKKAESVQQRVQFKDHQLQLAQTIALPLEGWKFKLDPSQNGQLFKRYESNFDDQGWEAIQIGKDWESQGHANYDGVAWYRRTIKLPPKPADAVGADLAFDAVDESAWIWVNGQYVGAHDIGPAGWDQPFAADVSDALKWGQDNQITVRVLDRAYAGGIWKPVYLKVYKQ